MDINMHVTKSLEILLLLVGQKPVLKEIEMDAMGEYIVLYYQDERGMGRLFIEHQYHGNIFRYKKNSEAMQIVPSERTEPFEFLFTLPTCRIRLDKYQYVFDLD